MKRNLIHASHPKAQKRERVSALTMVRFVGKGHLNDQNPFFGQILVRHLAEKLAFLEFSFRYRMI